MTKFCWRREVKVGPVFSFNQSKKKRVAHRSFVFGFVLFVLGCGEAPDRVYYPDGKLRAEVPKKDVKWKGFPVVSMPFQIAILLALLLLLCSCDKKNQRDFFPDGTLKSEVEIRNGEYDGVYREYFPIGKIRKEIEYKNGVMDGRYVEYFESGQPRHITSFVRGRRTSNEILRFEDGRINEITWYDALGRPQDFINFKHRGGRSDHRALIFF